MKQKSASFSEYPKIHVVDPTPDYTTQGLSDGTAISRLTNNWPVPNETDASKSAKIRRMITIEITGYGRLDIEHLVSDFSGTLSEDGSLLEGVAEKINELAQKIQVHILTSDTFGRARKELEGVNCIVHVLEGSDHSGQKERYVLSLGVNKVAALGNGNNDARMLRAAGVGIAVCLKEGCSVEALTAAGILVMSPLDAIDLLLNPRRLLATLRR